VTAGTPLGRVIRDADGLRLEFVRSFPDPIERVWEAITDPEELAVWWGTWRGDPSSGQIEVRPLESDGTFKSAEIVECDPPHRVAIILPTPYGPWPLSLTLSESEGSTTLVFVHRLAATDDAPSIGPGWHFYLDRLAAVVGGDALPEFDDWPAYEPLGASYQSPD
jgi:uncharacterized protein YndB with AHSA1/START domain